ncbi:MAG TPA: PIG-L family deacetylase [Acidimicrobiales bacterium]|nr:PIG-L family deacetylase [Acidimicrobiales bacterium]
MATVVFFHAHPDDESIATGGTMAKLAADGHRVVLVTATRGEHGEVPDGFLAEGEELWQRRERETEASARVLGVARSEFLGYVDSGMTGTPENEAPEAFWQADVEEAAERLARILREESAEVLTVYDDNGNYGHPDHIQVHRVGVRAAELAGVERVYESTVDQDYFRELMTRAEELGLPDFTEGDGGETPDGDAEFDMGKPAAEITTRVDVRGFLDVKRRSMQAHASQIAETSFFLAMPPAAFEATWGTEWYIRRGAPAGTVEDSLLLGIA